MGHLTINAKEALQFACQRHTVALFKEFLVTLEELAEEHDEALAKLAAALPAEYHPHLNLADYYTLDKANRLRRIVLQRGNDTARAIRDEIQRYEVTLG